MTPSLRSGFKLDVFSGISSCLPNVCSKRLGLTTDKGELLIIDSRSFVVVNLIMAYAFSCSRIGSNGREGGSNGVRDAPGLSCMSTFLSVSASIVCPSLLKFVKR